MFTMSMFMVPFLKRDVSVAAAVSYFEVLFSCGLGVCSVQLRGRRLIQSRTRSLSGAPPRLDCVRQSPKRSDDYFGES